MSMLATEDQVSTLRCLIDSLIRGAVGIAFAVSAGIYFCGVYRKFCMIDFLHPQLNGLSHLLAVSMVGIFALMVGCSYILRLRPVTKFAGAIPCAAAILGAFLLWTLVLLSPRQDLSPLLRLSAWVLIGIGHVLGVTAVWRLGRSFSILPEGRRLVTNGPYAVVRHPLYLAEAVATLGVLIHFLSFWALLVVGAQFSLQLVRMHYEEKVLRGHFPEYEDYARRTWRVIPLVY
jgi:protein-S-isoprenylcysteine O-methyltransferase Ste14